MNSIKAVFNETVAIGAGVYGALAGFKVGGIASTAMLTAAGLASATGVIPIAFCLATAAVTTGVGAAVGYRGAKAVLAKLEDIGGQCTPSRAMDWHRLGWESEVSPSQKPQLRTRAPNSVFKREQTPPTGEERPQQSASQRIAIESRLWPDVRRWPGFGPR